MFNATHLIIIFISLYRLNNRPHYNAVIITCTYLRREGFVQLKYEPVANSIAISYKAIAQQFLGDQYFRLIMQVIRNIKHISGNTFFNKWFNVHLKQLTYVKIHNKLAFNEHSPILK